MFKVFMGERSKKRGKMDHLGQIFTKISFLWSLNQRGAMANLANCVNAFRRSGLFPLNINGIDVNKYSTTHRQNITFTKQCP